MYVRRIRRYRLLLEHVAVLGEHVPRRANYGERPIYTVNHNDKPLVAIVTDPEAEGNSKILWQTIRINVSR